MNSLGIPKISIKSATSLPKTKGFFITNFDAESVKVTLMTVDNRLYLEMPFLVKIIHPKKRGPKPYKIILPGINVKIIKFESAAAYIMLPDGTYAWIDDIFVK